MRNIKLITEYDGTDFYGWQRQSTLRSVQQSLEDAIFTLTGENVNLNGSSRTDGGVHAMGHVSNFLTASTIPAERFAIAMNALLPDDVVVKGSFEMPEDFHARFGTKSKTYRYRICNTNFPSALERNRSCYIRLPLDLEAMKNAANCLVGEHDFKAFMAVGGTAKTTIRKMYEVDLWKEGEVVVFQIKGSGFLYNMVRIIVGTLIEVGMGKLPPDIVTKMIEVGDRRIGGRTVPPQGLYLYEVEY